MLPVYTAGRYSASNCSTVPKGFVEFVDKIVAEEPEEAECIASANDFSDEHILGDKTFSQQETEMFRKTYLDYLWARLKNNATMPANPSQPKMSFTETSECVSAQMKKANPQNKEFDKVCVTAFLSNLLCDMRRAELLDEEAYMLPVYKME